MYKLRILATLACVITLTACGKAQQGATSHADSTQLENAPIPSSATALPEVVANDNCGINAPAAGGEFELTKKLSVWGYAFNRADWTVPAEVSVRIASLESETSKLTVSAVRGQRADIAEATRHPEVENSGFGVEVDVSVLTPGTYMVSVLQQVGGQVLVCNNPLPITLK